MSEPCTGRIYIGDDRMGGFVMACELQEHEITIAHRVTYDACQPEASLRWYGTYEAPSPTGPVTCPRCGATGRLPLHAPEETCPIKCRQRDLVMHRLDEVLELLRIYEEADLYDDLLWRVADGAVTFAASCSDTFHWGSADAEEITSDDLPLLRQCLDDLRPFDEHHLISALYAARKRGMRPMRLWLDHAHILSTDQGRSLFLAAGPERDPESEG